jgi:hypothetical protein
MDEWGWEQLHPWLARASGLPVGPLFWVIDGPTRGPTVVWRCVRHDVRQRRAAALIRSDGHDERERRGAPAPPWRSGRLDGPTDTIAPCPLAIASRDAGEHACLLAEQ